VANLAPSVAREATSSVHLELDDREDTSNVARIIKQPLDIALMVIAIISLAALFLAHEEPFARDALCRATKFCPTIANAKAWNKIFYDLAAGALVSLIFYGLIVRVPDYQR
jgi:hypothetical protein